MKAVLVCTNCGLKVDFYSFGEKLAKVFDWIAHHGPEPACHAGNYPWVLEVEL